jgi:pimeloyl-ACP methyl ester carboxylesterase
MSRPPPHVHGKEGVDGSSPSEGSAKAQELARDFSALLNLQEVQFAVVMELFMEHRKCRRAECPRRVGDGGPLALLSHSQCRISAFQGRELVPVEDDPHTVAWTRPDEINAGLLDLLAGNQRAKLQRSLRQVN